MGDKVIYCGKASGKRPVLAVVDALPAHPERKELRGYALHVTLNGEKRYLTRVHRASIIKVIK